MLLTRAPLDWSRITTQPIPCDLHVLNTPPAFILSQNQTLRKNDLIRLHAVAGMKISNRGRRPRGPASAHCFNIEIRCAAHNLIFFLFSTNRCFQMIRFFQTGPFLACRLLSHTVKELVARGLKSRSGGSHRDRRFVSRSPSVVATGKL